MTEEKKITKDVDNMGIWDKVCKTNPAHTKKMTNGAKLTAINAQAQRKMATEIFGPYGLGWGVKNQSYTVIGEIEEAKRGIILYTADFFYNWEGRNGEFPISSSISMVSEAGPINNRYTVLDDECIKKVATDALTKGLSYLGFNSDIHEGLWDDNRYVAELRKEFEGDNKSSGNKKQQAKTTPPKQPKQQPKKQTKTTPKKQPSKDLAGFEKVAGAIKKEIGDEIFMSELGQMGFSSLDEMASKIDQDKFMKNINKHDIACSTCGDVKPSWCLGKCEHREGETGQCDRWGNKKKK